MRALQNVNSVNNLSEIENLMSLPQWISMILAYVLYYISLRVQNSIPSTHALNLYLSHVQFDYIHWPSYLGVNWNQLRIYFNCAMPLSYCEVYPATICTSLSYFHDRIARCFYLVPFYFTNKTNIIQKYKKKVVIPHATSLLWGLEFEKDNWRCRCWFRLKTNALGLLLGVLRPSRFHNVIGTNEKMFLSGATLHRVYLRSYRDLESRVGPSSRRCALHTRVIPRVLIDRSDCSTYSNDLHFSVV